MVLCPFRDRRHRACAAVMGLAVGLGDMHRGQRCDDRYARTIEINCTTGLFKVLSGQVRRQRRTGHWRQSRLNPGVASRTHRRSQDGRT